MLSRAVYPMQADTGWKFNPKTRNGVPQDGTGKTALGRAYRQMVAVLRPRFDDDDPSKPTYASIGQGLLLKAQMINLLHHPGEEYDRWWDAYRHGVGDIDEWDNVDTEALAEQGARKRYHRCSECHHYRVMKVRSLGERFFIARLYRRDYGSRVRFIAGTTSAPFWDRVLQPYSVADDWWELSKCRPFSIAEKAVIAARPENRVPVLAFGEELRRNDPVEGYGLFGGGPED